MQVAESFGLDLARGASKSVSGADPTHPPAESRQVQHAAAQGEGDVAVAGAAAVEGFKSHVRRGCPATMGASRGGCGTMMGRGSLMVQSAAVTSP